MSLQHSAGIHVTDPDNKTQHILFPRIHHADRRYVTIQHRSKLDPTLPGSLQRYTWFGLHRAARRNAEFPMNIFESLMNDARGMLWSEHAPRSGFFRSLITWMVQTWKSIFR